MKTKRLHHATLSIFLALIASSVHAMQNEGGVFFGSSSAADGGQAQTERLVGEGSIIIQWSEKLDELSGFSKKTGRWQKLKIDPQERIQPICFDLVGAVRLKNGMAAYSAETGTWDVVHLPEDSNSQPAVSQDLVQFKEGEHFYTFAASTGRWTSPTDPALTPISIVNPSSYNISSAQLYLKLMDWIQTIPANDVAGSIQYSEGVLTLLPRTDAWQERVEAEINGLSTNAVAATQRQPSPQQFAEALDGGGGSGMPGGFPSQIGSSRQIVGGDVMITWSENNDELRGFSNSLGDWEILPMEKQQLIRPIVGGGAVAAVRLDDSIAAYSGTKGWWDVLPLSKGNLASPVVDNDLVKIEDNGHLYTFSAAKGRWTSPTDPEYQTITQQIVLGNRNGGGKTKSEIDAWFASLPKYKARAVSVNFNRGLQGMAATILGDRLSLFNELVAKIKSVVDSSVDEFSRASQGVTNEGISSDTQSVPSQATDLEPRLAKLRDELDQLEKSVATSAVAKQSDADETSRQAELRKKVEQAFDTRQQLQGLEAQRMRLKLQMIETNLEARQKDRQSIVDRRIEQLEKLKASKQ